MKDGRSTHLLFQYGDVPGRPASVYSLQPFLQYHVCFLYPLPRISQGVPAETFEEALGVIWCPNGRNTNAGCVWETYNRSKFVGKSAVAGVECDLFEFEDDAPPVTIPRNRFCATADGLLLSANVSFSGTQKLNHDTINVSAFSENIFSAVTPAPSNASIFDLLPLTDCVDLRPMTDCVDLRPMKSTSKTTAARSSTRPRGW